MQIVVLGDNLNDMSKPISGKKITKHFKLSSAEFAQTAVKVKGYLLFCDFFRLKV